MEIQNEKEKTVGDYIKAIRTSSKYDDISVELYKKLTRKDEPPYSEWIETWIIKCITEYSKITQNGSIKQDVLFASFALLPDYTLTGTTIKERLEYYLYRSDYLKVYPSKSKLPIEKITDKKESQDVMKKLEKFERNCLKELIDYIEEIPNIGKHIEKLDDYGHQYELAGKKKGYRPNELKLHFPKTSDPRPSNIQPDYIIPVNTMDKATGIIAYREKGGYKAHDEELKQILTYYITLEKSSELSIPSTQGRDPYCPNTNSDHTLSKFDNCKNDSDVMIEAVLGTPNYEGISLGVDDLGYNGYVGSLARGTLLKLNPHITKNVIAKNNTVYTIFFYIKKKEFDNFYELPDPLSLNILIQDNPTRQANIAIQVGYPTMPSDLEEYSYRREDGYIHFYNNEGTAIHLKYIYGSAVLLDPQINNSGKMPFCDWANWMTYTEDLPIECLMEDGDYESKGYAVSSNDTIKIIGNLIDSRISPHYQFGCYASFQVKTVYDATFQAISAIKTIGTDKWSSRIDAVINDMLEVIFIYINTDIQSHSDVTISLKLPSCLEYIRGSTLFYNLSCKNVATIRHDKIVDTAGFNIGYYNPNEGAIVHAQLKIVTPKRKYEKYKIYNTSTFFCVIQIQVSTTADERRTLVNLIDEN